MNDRRHLLPLLFFTLLLAATFLLAAGLDQLRLGPGTPFSLAIQSRSPAPGEPAHLTTAALLNLIRGLIILGIVLLPIYITIHLLTPQGRKKLLKEIVFLTLLLIAINNLPNNQEQAVPGGPTEGGPPTFPAVPAAGPLAIYTAQTPPWANYLLIVAIASLITLGFVLWVRWRSRRRSFEIDDRPTSLEKILLQAETALTALRSGEDFRNAVLRCYAEMARILSEERQLTRDRAMTPLEFEAFLIAEGLPEPPIHELTRLFEAVRYGANPPGKDEEQLAVRSLSEIIAACRPVQSRAAPERPA
ncbi:MAG TPA: DUF4129 domain-containing protein [Anaerolineaceae bacterium]|nr:DUF4129 domain-containing protein [Anaerolineaceae bacterium]